MNKKPFDRNITYYKIIHSDCKHFSHIYQIGLNVDAVEFNPSGTCQPGGLYFTTWEYIHMYFHRGSLIAEVKIPENARVYEDSKGKKWKADKIEILCLIPLNKYYKFTESYILQLIKSSPGQFISYAKYLENPSEEFCLEIAEMYFSALHYLENPSYRVQLRLMKHLHLVNDEIIEQTKVECEKAIEAGLSITTCTDKCMPKVWYAVIEQNVCAFECMPKKYQTTELCLRVIKERGSLYLAIREDLLNDEMKKITINYRGFMIQYIKNPTLELCCLALDYLVDNIIYIKDQELVKVLSQMYKIPKKLLDENALRHCN